jgi:hypothetical protein
VIVVPTCEYLHKVILPHAIEADRAPLIVNTVLALAYDLRLMAQ